jgi:hypothetical protein
VARVLVNRGSTRRVQISQYTQLFVSAPDGAVFIIQRAIAGM